MNRSKMTNRNFSSSNQSAHGRLIALAFGFAAFIAAGAFLFFENAPAEAHKQTENSQKTPLGIRDMRLLSADAGWVSGERQLLRTATAGRDWTDITPPIGAAGVIEAVFFLDAENGWALASNNETAGRENNLRLFATVDGGRNWTDAAPITVGEDGIGTAAIDFVDEQHGWISVRLPSNSNFSRGLLFGTVDGGKSWKKLPPPPVGNAANFVSANDGWLAGGAAGDQLYVTRDGGRTWKPQTISPAAERRTARKVYHRPTFENEREGVLPVTIAGETGASLVFYRTTDGGEIWEPGASLPLSAETDADEIIASSIVDFETIFAALPKENSLSMIAGREIRRNSNPLNNLTPEAAVVQTDFKTAADGWILTASGRCAEYKANCTQKTSLLATADGGLTTIDITPQVTISETKTPDVDDAVGITRSKGFDKCTVGSVSNMQSWYTNTPWLDTNIYIGGANRGCAQPLLTASWITQTRNQGWKFIPTWVGPQAPGSSCTGCSKMSTTAATARSQGRTEADRATNAANALGLTPPTIIYYDMEQYTTTTAGRAAVKAFIDGWVTRINERGNQAGVYGSARNALDDWHGAGVRAPRAVWIAKWDNRETVFGLTPLPDNLWANSQRIHQYRGPHNETWGGVTFNIDSNILDGPVEDR